MIILNAYAQQGGAATGGGAQLNQGTGLIITCTVNNACVITGNSANGGSATGGNANNTPLINLLNTSSPLIQTNNTSINKAPIANADTEQNVNEGNIVLLNGSKSYDPNGDPITFSWRQIEGPVVKIDNTTSPSPSFVAPSNIQTDTKLTFELTVKDNNELKGSSIVTVTNKHNLSPPNKPNPSKPIIPEGYLNYTNLNYGITFNYNSNWTKQEGIGPSGYAACDGCSDIVTLIPTEFINADQFPSKITISTIKLPNSTSITEALDDEISAAKSLKHFKLISSNSSSTLSGKPAYTFEYAFDIKFNKKTHHTTSLETGTFVGNTLYFIDYTAISDKYFIYLPVVQNIIDSFKILKPGVNS